MSQTNPMTLQTALQYPQDVVDGKYTVGRYIRLACERHLSDMSKDTSDEFPFYFDEAEAQKILDWFFFCIKHTRGALAGEPMVMEPWQQWILISIYGWRRRNTGAKRFRNVDIFVARKNNKSTFSSGMVLYHLLVENVEGGQAFSIATDNAQARICWNDSKQMITKLPSAIKDKFKTTISEISVPSKFNWYRPLSRESKSLDGFSATFALFDEAAQITARNMYDVMLSSQGSLQDYMNMYITTAAFDQSTAYKEQHDYCNNMLDGLADMNDDWFAAHYCLDKEVEDQWDNPELWPCANPNLGASISEEYLAAQVREAKEIPSKRNNVLVKHFNVFTSSSEAWIAQEEWDKNVIPEIDTTGELYVGVDLGSTSDLTALTFVYKNVDKYHVDYVCFLPEATMNTLPKYVKQVYLRAIESKKLILTMGNATDYRFVTDYLQSYTADKNLVEIAYDPWSSQKWATELVEQGAPLVEVNQGMRHLSPATIDTEIHILKGELLHLGDPFFGWQMSNSTVYTDVNDNKKVRKGDDNNLKVDAVIAMITAMSRASANGGLNKKASGAFFIPFN